MSTAKDVVDTVARTCILGGEIARRNMTGLSKPVLMVWASVGVLGVVVWYIGGGGVVAIAMAITLYVATLWATLDIGGRQSPAAGWVHTVRRNQRYKAGEHIYRNAADPAYGVEGLDPGWEYPVPLGRTAPLPLAGTGLDDMFIVRNNNPGEKHINFVVVLAVQGLAGGLRGDAVWAGSMQAFGRTMEHAAKRTSFVRGWSEIHHVVPGDLAQHENWVAHQVSKLGDERLRPAVEAYGSLIDVLRPHAEEHRSYVVLRFPQTEEFMDAAARAARRKGASIEGGTAQVIRDETMRMAAVLDNAGYGPVHVYGEQRTCAVIRAFFDPDFKLDRHQGASWSNCWPSYVGGPDAVVVNDKWHTRVGLIPPRSIEPVELGPLWLAPLLTGVDPDPGDDDTPASATIRTIVVRADFVPDRVARNAAKGDATQDLAAKITESKKGKIGDGSTDVMATASARRQEDLTPGSGHHGLIYSMWISVTGRDSDDLDRACMRVTEALDESAIKDVDWQTDNHDVALFTTLPLGRGLAATRHTK